MRWSSGWRPAGMVPQSISTAVGQRLLLALTAGLLGIGVALAASTLTASTVDAQVTPIERVICGTDEPDLFSNVGGSGNGIVAYGGDAFDYFDNRDGSGDGHVFFGGGEGDVFANIDGTGDGHIFYGGDEIDIFNNRGGAGSGYVFFGGALDDIFDNQNGSGGLTSAEEIVGDNGIDNTLADIDAGDVSCAELCVTKVMADGRLNRWFTVTVDIGLSVGVLEDLDSPAYVTTPRDETRCYSFPPETDSVTVSQSTANDYSTSIACTQGATPLADADPAESVGAFSVTPSVVTTIFYGDGTTTPGPINCVITNTPGSAPTAVPATPTPATTVVPATPTPAVTAVPVTPTAAPTQIPSTPIVAPTSVPVTPTAEAAPEPTTDQAQTGSPTVSPSPTSTATAEPTVTPVFGAPSTADSFGNAQIQSPDSGSTESAAAGAGGAGGATSPTRVPIAATGGSLLFVQVGVGLIGLGVLLFGLGLRRKYD